MRQKLDKAVNVYADGQLVRGKCSDYGEGGKISSARVSPAELRGFQFQETMITGTYFLHFSVSSLISQL